MSYQLASIQDHIGALLLEWESFKAGKTNAASIEQLIERVATKAEVELFAVEGEQVEFRPFEHFLADEPDSGATQVRIIKSGARATRIDGSTRIVTRALAVSKP